MINPDFDVVEVHIQDWLSTVQVPGMALALSHENSIIFEYYGGVSNLELGTPVSIDTVFEIASVAKQFCALAILQLVQSGQLKLKDSVTNYFFDKSKSWSEITIEHLLTHTSGILNYYSLPEERIPTIETIEESINDPYISSLYKFKARLQSRNYTDFELTSQIFENCNHCAAIAPMFQFGMMEMLPRR